MDGSFSDEEDAVLREWAAEPDGDVGADRDVGVGAPWSQLPPTMLARVFLFLPLTEAFSASTVCKSWGGGVVGSVASLSLAWMKLHVGGDEGAAIAELTRSGVANFGFPAASAAGPRDADREAAGSSEDRRAHPAAPATGAARRRRKRSARQVVL